MYSEDNSEYGDDRNSDYLQWSCISVQTVVGLDVFGRSAEDKDKADWARQSIIAVQLNFS